MLAAFICLFSTVSCIYGADIDDDIIDDFSASDIDDLAEDRVEIISSSDDSEADIPPTYENSYDMSTNSIILIDDDSISNNKTHFNHYDGKSHSDKIINKSGHGSKKSSFDEHDLDFDENHNHKTPKYDVDVIKPHNTNVINADMIIPFKENAAHKFGHNIKPLNINADKTIHFKGNTTHASRHASCHNCELTDESEFCWCNKGHHDCNHCLHSIESNGVIMDYDNLANSFNAKINTSCIVVLSSGNDDEEENRNRYMNHAVDFQNQDKTSNIGFNNDLSDSSYVNFTEFEYCDLNIDSLYTLDLDIKDYNLEYYLFTNPDIIIVNKANVENIHLFSKTNTFSFNNHCLKNFDMEFTIHPTTFYELSAPIVFSDNDSSIDYLFYFGGNINVKFKEIPNFINYVLMYSDELILCFCK